MMLWCYYFMNTSEFDKLLASYEARPAVVAGRGRRAAGMALGAELNRLQGWAADEVDRRLIELFISGRINRSEFVRVVLELARLESEARALV